MIILLVTFIQIIILFSMKVGFMSFLCIPCHKNGMFPTGINSKILRILGIVHIQKGLPDWTSTNLRIIDVTMSNIVFRYSSYYLSLIYASISLHEAEFLLRSWYLFSRSRSPLPATEHDFLFHRILSILDDYSPHRPHLVFQIITLI
jgi:hypothetical protein